MAATVNLADVAKIVWGYFKAAIGWALLVFIALTVLKLFGFQIINVATLGWQELGIFLAGTAYALKNL